jgi:hypothetical protein
MEQYRPQREGANHQDVGGNLRKGGASTLCSGTLGQLDLKHSALGSLDVGKITHIIGQSEAITDLRRSVGSIIVNADTWDGKSFSELQRVHKDAEVHSLCLLLLWHKGADDLHAALLAICSDLVFDFQVAVF